MRPSRMRAKRVEELTARMNVKCKAEPGVFHPDVDARRCEGKGDCVAVCPYNVFELGRITDEVFKSMSLPVKLKLWAHGKKTVYTPNADACRACGLCVAACPERAIRLVRHNIDSHSKLSN